MTEENYPTVWFYRLETELEKGNLADAAKAQAELDRLGVKVRFKGRMARKLAEGKKLLNSKKTVLEGRL
jgi:hypothetical protein